MTDAAVENDRGVNTAVDRMDTGFQLGDHAAADGAIGDQPGDIGRRQVGKQRLVLGKHAGDIGQQEQPRRTQCRGDGAGHRIGIDVVGMAIGPHPDRRDDRHDARRQQRVDDRGVDAFGFADKAEVDDLFDGAAGIAGGALHLHGAYQTGVLARNAGSAATGALDPGDEFLVDRTGQHHFGHLRGGGIGDAQAIDEAAFDAQPLQHRADLRAAAMDDDGQDTDRLQQHDVFGKILRQCRIAHGMAAVFDDEDLARIALQIGQRFDQRFRLGEHFGVGSMGHGSPIRRSAAGWKRAVRGG